jgi:hypothetical protein
VSGGRDVTYKAYDIITVKDQAGDPVSPGWTKSRLPLALAIFFPLMAVAVEGGLRIGARMKADPLALRRQRAYGTFRKNLKKVKACAAGSPGEFSRRATQALGQYLSDKTGLPAAGITADIIDSALVPGGLSAEAAGRIRKVFEGFDMVRFGAGASEPAQREKMIAGLEEAVSDIERQFKKEGRA